MTCHPYSERVARCAGLMKAAGLDILLLAKPANMAYLTGEGRLCAYAMITKEGKGPRRPLDGRGGREAAGLLRSDRRF